MADKLLLDEIKEDDMGALLIWPSGAAVLVGLIALVVNLHKCFGKKKAPKKILIWPILLIVVGIFGMDWSAKNFIYL